MGDQIVSGLNVWTFAGRFSSDPKLARHCAGTFRRLSAYSSWLTMRRAIRFVLPSLELSRTEISTIMLTAIFLLAALVSFGQAPEGSRRQQQAAAPQATPMPSPAASPAAQSTPARRPEAAPTPAEEPPVVTHHEIKVNGKTLRYTATVGLMPIKNRDGETEARMFFMAYTLDNPGRSQRPMTFTFNGGPG